MCKILCSTNKKLPPQRKSDQWEKEQEQLIGTMITAATFQSLEGKKVKTMEENIAENIYYYRGHHKMYKNSLYEFNYLDWLNDFQGFKLNLY